MDHLLSIVWPFVTGKCASFKLVSPLFCVRRGSANNSRIHRHNIDFCVQLVRRAEYESFLCVLLLPRRHRDAVFAVRAFNVSLAQIADQISLPLLAQARLAFWRERVLDPIFAHGDNEEKNKSLPVAEQPVALELAAAVRKHNLSRELLYDLVALRSEAVEKQPLCADLAQLTQYSQRSHGNVFRLTLEIVGVRDAHSDAVAHHMAAAYGLVAQLRAAGNGSANRRMLCPELCRSRQLARQCLAQAQSHLQQARATKLSRRLARRVFLCGAICEHYMRLLGGAGDCDVYSAAVRRPYDALPLQLLKHRWLGTF